MSPGFKRVPPQYAGPPAVTLADRVPISCAGCGRDVRVLVQSLLELGINHAFRCDGCR